MTSLTVAAFATALTGVLLRRLGARSRDLEVAIASNYLAIAVFGWISLGTVGDLPALPTSAVLLGLSGGAIWPVAFLIYARVIDRSGLALGASWARLSLVVPVFFGLVVFREPLTPATTIGLVVLGGAFFLLAPRAQASDTHGLATAGAGVGLVFALVVIFGFLDVWVNVFNHVSPDADGLGFLVVLFTSAATLSWLSLVRDTGRVVSRDVAAGLALGVPNFATTWFLLQGLKTDQFGSNSTAAYSVYSALSLVLTVGAGVVLWREQLTGRHLAGIAFAIGAILALGAPT